MKTELQIIEELIEEKTKEFIQANALLMRTLDNHKEHVSFGVVQNVYGLQLDVEHLDEILQDLHSKRLKLLGDFTEEELILDSRDKVLEYLKGQPKGTYRLVRIGEREENGKE